MKKINYSFLFRIFGIALFVYIISKIDLAALFAALKQTNPFYYLISIFFLALSFLTRVLRWQILVHSMGSQLSFAKSLTMSAKGLFLGTVIPGRLGEFWRAKYLVKDTGISWGKAFYSAFLDRLLDLLVVGAIGLAGLVVIYFRFGGSLNWQIEVLALFSLASLFYFFVRGKKIKKLFFGLVAFFIPDFLKERATSFLADFYQGFSTIKLTLFLKVLALAFLYYLFGGVVLYYLIALALGVSIPLWYLFAIVAIVWVVMAVPVSVLGFGTREAAFIYFFSLLNISSSSAVALSLLAFLGNILVLALPGAILFLKHK